MVLRRGRDLVYIPIRGYIPYSFKTEFKSEKAMNDLNWRSILTLEKTLLTYVSHLIHLGESPNLLQINKEVIVPQCTLPSLLRFFSFNCELDFMCLLSE